MLKYLNFTYNESKCNNEFIDIFWSLACLHMNSSYVLDEKKSYKNLCFVVNNISKYSGKKADLMDDLFGIFCKQYLIGDEFRKEDHPRGGYAENRGWFSPKSGGNTVISEEERKKEKDKKFIEEIKEEIEKIFKEYFEQKNIEEEEKREAEEKENRVEKGILKRADLENMLYSDLTEEEQGTIKQRTLQRIEPFKKFWSKGNLQEAIVKFVPQAIKMPTNGNGKDIYKGNSDIRVIFDINGNYFRIQNTKINYKRSYLDLHGNIVNNEKIERNNGKIVEIGISPSKYQLLTHFSCDIGENNNMLQKDKKTNEKEISNPKWFIVVPLNEQGIEDCDFDRDTDNVKQFVFDRNDEYYAILGIGFKVWKKNIFIDEYETTLIEPKDFYIIRKAIKTYDYSEDVPHFLEAMELAERCNTYLELWM